MKRLLTGVTVLCMIIALCACSGAEQPASEPQGVTLRVVTSYGSEDGNRKAYETAVAEYEKATGNTVLDNSDTSNEEWKARVLTDFETGSEPDVLFFFANADAEPLIRANKVVSIAEIRQEFPDYAENMDSAKLPVASDGKSYAVPIMGYWEYLYVNKRVLEDCGVVLPGSNYTWDRFLRDCARIRARGYTPIACSLAEVSHYWFEFAVLNNGSVANHADVPRVDAEGHLVENGTAAKWIAGLEDIRELYENNCFPPNTLTAGDAETAALFGEGKAAFLLDGSWKLGYFTENYSESLDDFAVTYVPAKGERQWDHTIGGISTGFFITRKAWNDPVKREAAVAFVSHLTSDAVIGTFVTTELTALKEDVVPENMNTLQQTAAEAKAGTSQLVGAVQDAISGEARSSLFANIRNVVTGKMSAHDAVETAMQLN